LPTELQETVASTACQAAIASLMNGLKRRRATGMSK
jgi:hypothetical protein